MSDLAPLINLPDTLGWTALHEAARCGSADSAKIVQLLLGLGARTDLTTKLGETAEHLADITGHHEIVTMIQEHNKTFAAANKAVEKVPVVLVKDDEVIENLLQAPAGNDFDLVKVMLDTGVLNYGDVNQQNKDGNTLLHFEAFNGHQEIVEYLVDHGADVNVQDRWAIPR